MCGGPAASVSICEATLSYSRDILERRNNELLKVFVFAVENSEIRVSHGHLVMFQVNQCVLFN